MFCGKCGAEIKNGDSFCTNCGTRVETSNISSKLELPFEIGSILQFGIMEQDSDIPTPLEWIILDRVEQNYLLFSKNIINCMSYYEGLDWLMDGDKFLSKVFITSSNKDIYNCDKVEGYQFLGDISLDINTGLCINDGLFGYMSVKLLNKYNKILDNIKCSVTKYACKENKVYRAWLEDVSPENRNYNFMVEENHVDNLYANKDEKQGIRPAMWVRFY